MRQFLSLPRLVIAVWLAWLGLVGLMFVMQARQVWHPHFLPLLTLLAMLVVAGLALIVGATWRLLRGPGRRRALACLLLGVAPLGFMTGYGMYGLEIGFGRNFRLNLPLKMLVPLGGSLMDLEARYRYPQRTVGEKVTMISTPVAEAREQVAAMDEHVRRLEARLGRTAAWSIRWVRGPLFGLDGQAIFNLGIGSRACAGASDAGRLTSLDRHEVAHCVITSLNSADSEPPAVLVEGWAAANEGTDPTEQILRLCEQRGRGGDLSLRELTGPEWYWRHEGPAYEQGALLVNYLLRRFGSERFVEFYTTCGPATFADDCRRILGVSLDDLDAAFWADVERIMAAEGSIARGRLARFKPGPGVAADAWRTFLDEYASATERLLSPYQHIRMTMVSDYTTIDARGQTDSFSRRLHLARSGETLSLLIESRGGDEAYLANPKRPVQARRASRDSPWEVEDDPRANPGQSYRHLLYTIDLLEPTVEDVATLLHMSNHLRDYAYSPNMEVAGLDRFIEDGRRLVRVRLQDPPSQGGKTGRSLTLNLSPDEQFAVRSFRHELADGHVWQGEVEYDVHDGIPVLRASSSSSSSPDGSRSTSSLRVVERSFVPIPEEEFDPERVLVGPQVRQVVDRHPPEETSALRWYRVPLVIGAVSLAIGLSIPVLRPTAMAKGPKG